MATTTKTSTVKKPRPGIHDSEKVRAKADRQRINKPVVLKGVSKGSLVTITPKDYKWLDIDVEYQRGEVKGEINQLMAAIQSGGLIPDPVTLVRRTWESGDAAKRMWVIDGQQRIAAFSLLDMPFQAMVYEVDTYDAEKNFFLAMNTRVALNASIIVHSWPGPGAELIRQADKEEGHPLFKRVLWTVGSNNKVGAAILAKGMTIAASGLNNSNGVQHLLNRLDYSIRNDQDARARAAAFVLLAGHVFPSYAHTLAMTALAVVAHRKWSRVARLSIALPSKARLARLSKLKWDKLVPGYASRWRGVLEQAIEERWSGSEPAESAE